MDVYVYILWGNLLQPHNFHQKVKKLLNACIHKFRNCLEWMHHGKRVRETAQEELSVDTNIFQDFTYHLDNQLLLFVAYSQGKCLNDGNNLLATSFIP